MKVPLPSIELNYLNSYLIKADNGAILVDTGIDSEEAFSKLNDDLKYLNIDIDDLTEIIITHFHADHMGLFQKIKDAKSGDITARLNAKETELLEEVSTNFGSFLEKQLEFGRLNGVPRKITESLKTQHPGFRKTSIYEDLMSSNVPMKEGEDLESGRYCFKVIETPGHSPGHMCLYEPKKKVLIAGDHLLKNTTPHVTQRQEGGRPLSDYFRSLKKIKDLDVNLVLPGHGNVFKNHRKRSDQLLNHHKERLKETESSLKGKKLSAYQLAPKISWDVNYHSWEKFPVFQKWLATGETLAHLKFLEDQNKVEGVFENGLVLYQRKE